MVYDWTPTVEGKYNITVYTIPVAGEHIVENNVKTTFVPVSQKIALISDNYELDRITLTLDSMWINYDSYDYNYASYTQKTLHY